MRRTLLLGAVLVLFATSSTGCIYHHGSKVFDSQSDTDEGAQAVADNDIKYVCKKTFGIFWGEFYRSGCDYAVDVTVSGDMINYNILDPADVERLELKPRFTFWQRFGAWISAVLLIVVLVGSAFLKKLRE